MCSSLAGDEQLARRRSLVARSVTRLGKPFKSPVQHISRESCSSSSSPSLAVETSDVLLKQDKELAKSIQKRRNSLFRSPAGAQFREQHNEPKSLKLATVLTEGLGQHHSFKSPVQKIDRGNCSSSTSTPLNVTPTCDSPEQNEEMTKSVQKRRSSLFHSPAGVLERRSEPKRLKLSTILVEEVGKQQLLEKEAKLDDEITLMQAEGLTVEELDYQINLLHLYNETKDAAQVVIGRLAELEGVTVKSLHEKYSLPLDD